MTVAARDGYSGTMGLLHLQPRSAVRTAEALVKRASGFSLLSGGQLVVESTGMIPRERQGHSGAFPEYQGEATRPRGTGTHPRKFSGGWASYA
jgi:hypothetical protein